MNAIDTNIWLYSHDVRDPAKQTAAQNLIASTHPLALPWQVGCEFIAGSRKLAPDGFDEAKAWLALDAMQAMATSILLPTTQLWADARDLQQRYSISFWDALLIAACIRNGVRALYTEDIGAPRSIDSLALVNPFLANP
ncbi:MAG: PIN domain-containing protein [Gemmataceae bacterium]|nr:PIN domain-containing protein [Gemmataceae bacterium]